MDGKQLSHESRCPGRDYNRGLWLKKNKSKGIQTIMQQPEGKLMRKKNKKSLIIWKYSKRQRFGPVFSKFPVRISTGTPTILIEAFPGFSQSPLMNTRLLS
jgi:hypothetical protein